jgi:hypothetical protein
MKSKREIRALLSWRHLPGRRLRFEWFNLLRIFGLKK